MPASAGSVKRRNGRTVVPSNQRGQIPQRMGLVVDDYVTSGTLDDGQSGQRRQTPVP
jgi:hypothetical protein